ncbi:MAG: hypothetical protein M0038_14800, partial [Pseudomonadota bacterium]|nr:hypothetical protein [Pseudomonadota bacterium]
MSNEAPRPAPIPVMTTSTQKRSEKFSVTAAGESFGCMNGMEFIVVLLCRHASSFDVGARGRGHFGHGVSGLLR